MKTMTSKFSSLGFDAARTRYALRTAIASCIALALAFALGLEHPQWSAMTVWAASQPMRGHLLEKCLFRVAGTLVGTVAGIALMIAMTIDPLLLVFGLAAWVGLCTFIGNLQRGFIAYGALLAGYTAAMVSLLDTAHPDHVMLLGADRLATIVIGVIVAALIGYIFTKHSSTDILRSRAFSLFANILRHIASKDSTDEAGNSLLEDLSAIEAELDQHAAGSPNRHQQVHALRGLLINGISMIMSARSGIDSGLNLLTSDRLLLLAAHIDRQDLNGAAALLDEDLHRAPKNRAENSTFTKLRDTLTLLETAQNKARISTKQRQTYRSILLHKDIRSARDAALRVSLCLLAFGLLWATTGIAVLGFMLLGLSVMLSVFSSFENPAVLLRHVVLGQMLGVIAALSCRWLFWPMATAEWQLIAIMMPFILIAPLLVGHRKTVFVSFDYSMVSLLLLSPHFPLTGTFTLSLSQGLAVVSAPVIAIFAFRYLFPATLSRKVDHLVAMMLKDIEQMASDNKALNRSLTWHARFYHRALILLRQASLSQRHRGKAHEINRAVLTLGQLVMQSHSILRDEANSAVKKQTASEILAHSARISKEPQQLAHYLASLDDSALPHIANAASSAQQIAALKAA